MTTFNRNARTIIVSLIVALTMLISACSDPITSVDNAVSPAGSNCGSLVC